MIVSTLNVEHIVKVLNILLRCCKSTHTKRGQICDGGMDGGWLDGWRLEGWSVEKHYNLGLYFMCQKRL